MDDEFVVKGTLNAVAAAAAPFAPWGTVAAAAIVGGTMIYDTIKAAEEKEISDLGDEYIEKQLKTLQKIAKDAQYRASLRPQMSIDLNSGPPMYWIVEGKDQPIDGIGHFKIPGGDVNWPRVSGGMDFLDQVQDAKDPSDLRYVYQPDSPQRLPPRLCVFFWSVPLFFARLQQRIGDQIFGAGHDPKSLPSPEYLAKPRFQNCTTKEEISSSIMKEMMFKGEFDKQGNWYGEFGFCVPVLAESDDDFAPRYYGRSLWAHAQAVKQISVSDGSRLAFSGMKYSGKRNTPINKDRLAYAEQYLDKNPRIVLAKADGTSASGRASGSAGAESIAPQCGTLMDLQTLISTYYIDDKGWNTITKDSTDPHSLFYVTSVLETDTVNQSRSILSRSGPYLSPISALSNKVPDSMRVMANIDYAGPFVPWCGYSPKVNQSISGLSSCPFFLGTCGVIVPTSNDTSAPRPDYMNSTDLSSYGFYDFIPAKIDKIPGLNKDKNYEWLRRLSITPYVETSTGNGWKDIADSGMYTNYGWSWNIKRKSGSIGPDVPFLTFITAMKGLENVLSFKWASLTEDNLLKLGTFASPSFNSFVLNKSSPTGSTAATLCPSVFPIVKNRPPKLGEKSVKLHRSQFGNIGDGLFDCGSWVGNSEYANFAVVNPILPKGRKLVVIKINKLNMEIFKSEELPAMSAFFHTNMEENKPIVEMPLKLREKYPSPSPFYCGRRADSRLGAIFGSIRKLTTKKESAIAVGSKTERWDDCHDWAWPFPKDTLQAIGEVSERVYNELGEGIGRAGCSPSAYATGPTLWGDVSLYSKAYPTLSSSPSNDVDSEDFERVKAQFFWETLFEIQVGSYIRYKSRSNTTTMSLTQKIEASFAIYSNSESTKKFYTDQAKLKIKDGLESRIWDSAKNDYVYLTPEQNATYCMNVVDSWYRSMVPFPVKNHMDSYSTQNWTTDLLETTVKAHIRLKKWATREPGSPFPTKHYSINNFSAVDACKSIENYKYDQIQKVMPKVIKPNAATIAKLEKERNLEKAAEEKSARDLANRQKKSDSNLPIKVAAASAAVVIVLTALYLISRRNK